MALLPQIDGKDIKKLCMDANDDDDDFIPMKKSPKLSQKTSKPCLNNQYSNEVIFCMYVIPFWCS